jgi:hypothetical protein
MRVSLIIRAGLFLIIILVSTQVSSQIIDTVSTPRELWQRFEKTLPPPEISIKADNTIRSCTDPTKELRRLEFTFCSQKYEGKRWIHPCVLFIPSDYHKYGKLADRKGKVVIIAHSGGSETEPFLLNYGDPIATLSGYPTLVFQNPGEGREREFLALVEREMQKLTPDPVDHSYFRTAVPYLVALDIVANILKLRRDEIKAVIGGHSKRATSAYIAAAIDSARIRGVVYMGNESVWGITEGYPAVCPARIQKLVSARVLYLGASNEAYRPGRYEYHMYNINKIQNMMGGAWTIEYIPNHIHSAMSEKHFIDWRMWIGHVFDGRPVTRISELTFRKIETGTRFRARIDSDNKVIQVMLWHTYTGNVPPYWRDLLWHPGLMVKQDDGFYEGFVGGEIPDAWLVEVKDIASGIPGYVTSLPQDITGKRNWHVDDLSP